MSSTREERDRIYRIADAGSAGMIDADMIEGLARLGESFLSVPAETHHSAALDAWQAMSDRQIIAWCRCDPMALFGSLPQRGDAGTTGRLPSCRR